MLTNQESGQGNVYGGHAATLDDGFDQSGEFFGLVFVTINLEGGTDYSDDGTYFLCFRDVW